MLKISCINFTQYFSTRNYSWQACLGNSLNRKENALTPDNVALIQGKRGQKELIKKFLKQYFMNHDPLIQTAGFHKSKELLNFWVKDLREELTVLAVNPRTGQLLGLAVNTILRPDTAAKMRQAAETEIKDKGVLRMINFYADVTEKAKLFERFDINIMLECESLATHPSIRNRGLGKYMVLQSRTLAQAAGFPLLRMDCTSAYSAKIAKRLQMERLPSRQVVDYVDKDGVPWISSNPAPPNQKLTITFDRLCPGLCSKFPPPPPPKPKKRKRFIFF